MFVVAGNKWKSLILPLKAIFYSLVFFCQYALRFSPYLNRALHLKLSNLNELQMLNPGISNEDQSKNQSTLNPKEQGEKNNRST